MEFQEKRFMKKLKMIGLSIALIAVIFGSLQVAAAADLGPHVVWHDLNGDGLFDFPFEPGMSGVTVELYKCDGTFVASTTTDADGHYGFYGLLVGNYYEKVIPPSGYAFTLKDQGTDDYVDSDFDPVTGESPCVNLPYEGSVFCSLAAGLVCAPTGTEGLTPGFWKNHPELWVGYSPNQKWTSVFADPITIDMGKKTENSDPTLLEVLAAKGGINEADNVYDALARHAVAAILNAAHPNVDYPLSSASVISQVNSVINNGVNTDAEPLKNTLEGYNQLGGGIDAHVNPI